MVIVGGIIPDEDIAPLTEMGVAGVFTAGTSDFGDIDVYPRTFGRTGCITSSAGCGRFMALQ